MNKEKEIILEEKPIDSFESLRDCLAKKLNWSEAAVAQALQTYFVAHSQSREIAAEECLRELLTMGPDAAREELTKPLPAPKEKPKASSAPLAEFLDEFVDAVRGNA